MSTRLSKLYGMDIFTDGGKFLGRVHDLVVDSEKGEIVRIMLEPLQGANPEETKRLIRERSIMYKSVRSVEDVIVVSKGDTRLSQAPSQEEQDALGGRPSFLKVR